MGSYYYRELPWCKRSMYVIAFLDRAITSACFAVARMEKSFFRREKLYRVNHTYFVCKDISHFKLDQET